MYFELAKDIEGKKACLFDAKHKDWPKLKRFLDAGEAACSGAHFVGESLTLADCAMFKALHFMAEVKSGALADYPKLSAFVGHFASQPAVSAYLTSPRRMPLTPNEIGDKPHAGDKGYDFLQPMKAGSYAQLWEEPPPY